MCCSTSCKLSMQSLLYFVIATTGLIASVSSALTLQVRMTVCMPVTVIQAATVLASVQFTEQELLICGQSCRSGCLIHNGTYLTLSLTLTITLTLLTLTVTVRVTLTLLNLLTLPTLLILILDTVVNKAPTLQDSRFVFLSLLKFAIFYTFKFIKIS